MKTIRTGVTTDDSAYPAIGSGQKFNETKKVRFFPELSTGGSATFTILMLEDGEYVPAVSITCTDTTPFDIFIDRNSDVNCYITGVIGTVGIKGRLTNTKDC